MKTRLLIFAIALLLPIQLVYAQPIPEPEPVCKEGTILKNGACVSADGPMCGPGTTYQDGICVVDKIENSTESSSGKWGGYQFIHNIESPLKQIKSGVALIDIQCNDGMFVAYKIDNSKSACVTPDTLRELVSREWAFPHSNHGSWKVEAHSTIQLKETCTDKNQILVQGGYYPTRDFILEFIEIEKTEIEGYAGILLTLHNPTDHYTGYARMGNANVFVDCIDPDVSNFYECQDVSRYINTKNWPILECRTLDGKQFFVNENEEMAKNSGIELYTMNYLSSQSLEFVGKTDRVDQEISFSITAPNGDEISTWSEFAPSEGEFRTTITTAGPLWEQQDGLYIFTAKQVDVPYYTVYLEFELEDGKIIR